MAIISNTGFRLPGALKDVKNSLESMNKTFQTNQN